MDMRLVKSDEIVTLEDGFKYYWPHPNKGCFSPSNLRDIADYLDQLNEHWQEVGVDTNT